MRIACLSLVLWVGSLAASPVTILNPSFESGNLTQAGNGVFSQLIAGSTIFAAGGTLPDWVAATSTIASTAGGFFPSPGGFNWSSPWWDGNNVGYVQIGAAGTVSLSQVLSATLQDDTVYTLSALIGRRSFTPRLAYSLELWAGTTQLGAASNLALANDSFGSDSLVYSSGANNPLSGQALMIVLSSAGLNGSFTEAFFDQIALDAVTTGQGPDHGGEVPEPASLLLSAAGLGALIVRRGRR